MTTECHGAADDSLGSQYDAKIDACFAEIRRLREARNTDCSHTRMLPREVLTMIFRILQEEGNYIISYRCLPGWVGYAVVTHVCRMWRNTALSEPRLWADLSYWAVSSSRWAQELFVRSKATPLSLNLNGEPSRFSRHIFEQVLQCPERFKSLAIVDNKDYLLALTKPMPHLERLSAHHPAILPPNFACGIVPRLHCLELCGVDIPLNASWFSSVRKLSLLGEWSTNDGSPLTVKSFLAFLSRLPRLVDLSITLPKDLDATVCPSPGDVTRLSLKALHIGFGSSIRAFKEILRFVVVATLQSFVVDWSSDVEKCGVMGDAINFYVANTPAPSYSATWTRTEIRLTASLHDSSEDHTLCFVKFSQFHPDSLRNYVSDINITILMLPCHFRIFPMQECQTIEEVQIDGDTGLDQLLHLKPSDTIPVPYPSLRRLHLRKASFSPKTKIIPRIRRWISERKKLSGLEKLIVEDCGLTAKDVALLAKTIPVETIMS